MPSLGGATEWLNSEPRGPAGLRGHVVLVNFWTLTCINWLRQEPYIRAWSQAYRADGLVVIGVHTPEFSSSTSSTACGRRPPSEGSTIRSRSITTTRSGAPSTTNWPALYFVDTDVGELFGAEREAIAAAAPIRIREFAAGRTAARRGARQTRRRSRRAPGRSVARPTVATRDRRVDHALRSAGGGGGRTGGRSRGPRHRR